MNNLPICRNFILVSGTDRNVGKTTFACEIIKKFSKRDVTGLKISPHLHIPDHPENIIIRNDRYLIMEEKNRDGHKDSSKMLVSGAKRVFYLQATGEHVQEAFTFFTQQVIGEEPVVCESAALGKIIRAAAHFRVTRPGGLDPKDPDHTIKADFLVTASAGRFDFNLDRIELSNDGWHLRETL